MEQAQLKPDRYLSFKGIYEEENTQELIRMLRVHIDDPDKTNAFWEKFKTDAGGLGVRKIWQRLSIFDP